MRDVILGILSIVVGLTFCFRGYLTMRVVIPIWGTFSGFALGAGLVSGLTDNRFLGTALGWIVGLGVGLVFGALAYLYFEISVLLGMMSIGFILGASLMVALHVTWTWVIVVAGVAAGALAASIAMASDLPMLLLTVLTAFAGSSAVVAGTMLLAGKLHTDDLDQAKVIERVHDAPGWWVMYVALAVIGIAVQASALGSLRQTLRQEWETERGRSARPAS